MLMGLEYSGELFEQAALDQYVADTQSDDVFLTILPEEPYIHDMAEVIKMVMEVANHTGYAMVGSLGGCRRLNKTGRKYLRTLRIDSKELISVFKNNKLSPYIGVFNRARAAMSKACLLSVVESDKASIAEELEAVTFAVNFIEKAATNAVFKRYMKNYERAVKKNEASLNGFVDDLFERHSRLLVLRLDVGYSLPYIQSQKWNVNPERVKSDFNRFLRAMKRSRLKDALCGYVWKLEYGPTKKYHYHLMIFLDGSKHQEDVVIGKELGELWKGKITNTDGTYFNCNRDKEKYKRCGVGMVSWNEGEKINNIKHAGNYLVKLDLLVRPNLPDGERTFGRSGVNKNKSTAGRPRRLKTF